MTPERGYRVGLSHFSGLYRRRRMGELMYRGLFFAAAAMAALPACEAAAEVPLSGFFIAREACPALQSIRNGTNPGGSRPRPASHTR